MEDLIYVVLSSMLFLSCLPGAKFTEALLLDLLVHRQDLQDSSTALYHQTNMYIKRAPVHCFKGMNQTEHFCERHYKKHEPSLSSLERQPTIAHHDG